MSVPYPVCRECHRDDHHDATCSHLLFEGRSEVEPEDEVSAPHNPPGQPYCPGPTVSCYFTGTTAPWCEHTGHGCYYATTETQEIA